LTKLEKFSRVGNHYFRINAGTDYLLFSWERPFKAVLYTKKNEPEKVGGPGAAGHLVHGAEDQVVLRVPHQAGRQSNNLLLLIIENQTF
jgi:hypothetical protein